MSARINHVNAMPRRFLNFTDFFCNHVRLAAQMYSPKILSSILVMLVFVSGVSAQDLIKTQPAVPREVRALWVVRTTLTSPEKIATMVKAAKENGFNTLIVQVRGRGDAYYKSRKEPRAVELKDQPTDFDPLAVTIAAAKQEGLSVHAWINTSLLANLDAILGAEDG